MRAMFLGPLLVGTFIKGLLLIQQEMADGIPVVTQ